MLGTGELDFAPGADVPAPLFVPQKRFLRTIPYFESEAIAGRDRDYRQFACFVETDDGWSYVDKANEDNAGPRAHVMASDSEFGIRLRTPANHIMALGWGGVSDTAAAYDWQTMIFTGMFETDQVASVVVYLPAEGLGPMTRRKIIEVKDAQIWGILPGTVYDVQDGALVREPIGVDARNNMAMIMKVADYAITWFGRPRASVTLEIRSVLGVHPVGSMIAGIVGWNNMLVGTVVTRRTWLFQRCEMTVATNWEEIDWSLTGLMGDVAPRAAERWRPGMPVEVTPLQIQDVQIAYSGARWR
jgi:hypothetical protein